jgi:hypothetical protein
MIKLTDIEAIMRPQFIWHKNPQKKMQVNEDFEGNLELARIVFVGLADMYGHKQTEVMEYLDCGYDTYRNKLMNFRESWREGRRRENAGVLREYNDNTSKIYIKTGLCLNAIKYSSKSNPYLKMEQYIQV